MKAIVTAVVIISFAIAAPARAAWLMVLDQENIDDVLCPEDFSLIYMSEDDEGFLVCVPSETESESELTQSEEQDTEEEFETPTEDEPPPHTGPYEGVPLEGPQFN